LVERNRLMSVGSRVRLRLATDDGLVALVRAGDTAAFEAIYERYTGALLSFCAYMLGSRHDAEDAIQATFASAYRAINANDRPVNLRPWLYAIARNESLSILRRRRPTVELNGEPALGGDPVRELEVREELRSMVEGLRDLPERQRAALVLTEMHGLSQGEIGDVLGVRSDQVKAYVFQARSNLISDRSARQDDCREIREQLATARGAALLRGRLRRHLRTCSDCRVYADGVAHQRRQVAALLPIAPSLLLRSRSLGDLLGGAADPAAYAGSAVVGGSVADAALGIAGSGVKALALKVATGVALVGLSAGVGASVLGVPIEAVGQGTTGPSAQTTSTRSSVVAKIGPGAGAVGGSDVQGARLVGSTATESPAGGAGTGDARGGSSTGDGAGSAYSPDQGAAGAVPGAVAPGNEVQAGAEGHARKSEQERAQGQEEREHAGQERERAREEHEHAAQEHQRLHEQHEQAARERQQAREERKAKGVSRPPKTQEERQHAREEREAKGISRPPRTKEERQRAREEREAKGISRPPRSQEERQRAREQRRREHEKP